MVFPSWFVLASCKPGNKIPRNNLCSTEDLINAAKVSEWSNNLQVNDKARNCGQCKSGATTLDCAMHMVQSYNIRLVVLLMRVVLSHGWQKLPGWHSWRLNRSNSSHQPNDWLGLMYLQLYWQSNRRVSNGKWLTAHFPLRSINQYKLKFKLQLLSLAVNMY